MKKIILFLVTFLITTTVVVGYFKLRQEISLVNLPTIPAISLSDIVKLSRFSLDKAPSESLVGDITSVQGIVKFQDRNATESAVLTNPSVDIQQGEAFETEEDGYVSFQFPNLTNNPQVKINTFPKTSLEIVQTLPANIVFAQTSGTVEYQKLSDIPLSVRSLHLLTEIKGDVKITLDDKKPIISVKVISGSATVAYNNIHNISQVLTIPAGKTLTFNDTTRKTILK